MDSPKLTEPPLNPRPIEIHLYPLYLKPNDTMGPIKPFVCLPKDEADPPARGSPKHVGDIQEARVLVGVRELYLGIRVRNFGRSFRAGFLEITDLVCPSPAPLSPLLYHALEVPAEQEIGEESEEASGSLQVGAGKQYSVAR